LLSGPVRSFEGELLAPESLGEWIRLFALTCAAGKPEAIPLPAHLPYHWPEDTRWRGNAELVRHPSAQRIRRASGQPSRLYRSDLARLLVAIPSPRTEVSVLII
jgi:hypothetical protein